MGLPGALNRASPIFFSSIRRRRTRTIASRAERMDLSQMGGSGKNRQAGYYTNMRVGWNQLAAEEDNWRQISEILSRFIESSGGNL